MNHRGNLRRNRRGHMPMAMIAVALLVSSAFFCVITKNIEDTTDNARNLTYEIDALDEEMDRTVMQIEADLGDLISDLSAGPSGDDDSYDMIERAEMFDRMYREMFDRDYPSFNRGVRTDIISSDIYLTMESMKLGTEVAGFCDTQSTFLRAMGTVTLELSTESASSVETVEIVADAASCLPLIVESATEFELSLDGGDSAFAQMVDYQLTALAQNRIMNGYGALNVGGHKSTDAIITEDDVLTAVRNALDILETMSFRSNASDNTILLGLEQVDIADYMMVRDGCVTFDLGAFYGQTVYSNLDAYVMSWLEYLGTDVVLDFVDSVKDVGYNAYSAIIGFLTKKDVAAEDAKEYIVGKMREIGAEDDLRIDGPGSVYLVFSGAEFPTSVDDESVTLYVNDLYMRIDIPERSILDWGGWGSFHKDYNHHRNSFEESIKSLLKSVALNVKDTCKVTIAVDCTDDRTFSKTMKDSLTEVIRASNEAFGRYSENAVRSNSISDPYMYAVYEHIRNRSYEIFAVSDFDRTVDQKVKKMCNDLISLHPELSGRYDEVLATIIENTNVQEVKGYYRELVDQQVKTLESMYETIHRNNGLIINTLAYALGKVIDIAGLGKSIEGTMESLMERMVDVMDDEPSFEVTRLPGKDAFIMGGDSQSVYIERMDVYDNVDLDIKLRSPVHNGSRNIHYIGFSNWGNIAYSAVYEVGIEGTIEYVVTSSNTLSEALGTYDAMYTGSTRIDLSLDIPCISGWGLAGVDYRKSNTLISDIWVQIFNLIEPFLDDLMEVFRTIKDLERLCSNIMLEFGNRISEMMTQIYEMVSVPLEILQIAMETYFQDLMDNIGLENLCIKLGSQSLTFDVYGTKVTIDTNIRSLYKNTKEIVTVTLSKEVAGMIASASCAVKKTVTKGYCIIVKGGAEGPDWKFNLSFDPLLATRQYYVGIDGSVRNVAYSGTIPELVQYRKLDIALSDFPGIGTAMSNIPTPIPGVKCSVDAGAYVKYALPIKNGLLINEVELNPEGSDAGKEWVELLNNTDAEIDLTGYVLIPASGEKKSYTIEEGIIGPGERMVITFPKQTLNNSGSKGLKGEMVTLNDPAGNLVDKTEWLTDQNDNGFTNQRSCDGYVHWGYNEGSPGEKNGNNIPGLMFEKATFTRYLGDAIVEILDDMGGVITTTEGLITFIERVIAKIVERIIDTIADTLVEAYVYIELTFQDITGSLGTGLKVMVGLDSEIVADTLRYLVSMVPMIGEHINNPAGMSAERILMDDIYLRTVAYSGISIPSFLKKIEGIGGIEAGVSLKINISAIASILSIAPNNSQWSAETGIVLENVPTEMIPKAFDAYDYYDQDLWLFRMTFSRIMEA